MSTGDQIALWGTIVAAVGVSTPIVFWWLSKRDDKQKFIAKIYPHVFIDGSGKPALHGMAVDITCLSKEPIEIVDVRLRCRGVNVIGDMMSGWSAAKPFELSKFAKPEDSGIDVQLRVEYNGQLILNSNKSGGAVVRKNKSMTFFTPLPILPPHMQMFFTRAKERDLSVAGHILPEKKLDYPER